MKKAEPQFNGLTKYQLGAVSSSDPNAGQENGALEFSPSKGKKTNGYAKKGKKATIQVSDQQNMKNLEVISDPDSSDSSVSDKNEQLANANGGGDPLTKTL